MTCFSKTIPSYFSSWEKEKEWIKKQQRKSKKRKMLKTGNKMANKEVWSVLQCWQIMTDDCKINNLQCVCIEKTNFSMCTYTSLCAEVLWVLDFRSPPSSLCALDRANNVKYGKINLFTKFNLIWHKTTSIEHTVSVKLTTVATVCKMNLLTTAPWQ